jgi:hypothetical protein
MALRAVSGALVEERLERCGFGEPPAPLERYPQSGPDLGERSRAL